MINFPVNKLKKIYIILVINNSRFFFRTLIKLYHIRLFWEHIKMSLFLFYQYKILSVNLYLLISNFLYMYVEINTFFAITTLSLDKDWQIDFI